MGTEVILSARLPKTVFVYQPTERPPADEHFCNSDFMVMDGIEWNGLGVLRAHLIPKHRRFNTPFHPAKMPDEIGPAMDAMKEQAQKLVDDLYVESHEFISTSLRPMQTGPEPMHFDVYPAPIPVLTCFINVAATPRVYRIGPTFAHLVKTEAYAVRQLAVKVGWTDISYRMRDNTVEGIPPMPKDGEAHRIELAPGAAWFFNGKTVSHQVVYGEGALGMSWTFPKSAAPTQEQMMAALK